MATAWTAKKNGKVVWIQGAIDRQNKVKAVEWAKDFMKQNALIFAPGTAEHFLASTKQDDLADSLLLAMFYLDTYSNQ